MDLIGKFQIGCVVVLAAFFLMGMLSVWILLIWTLVGTG